jgi:hypothetical protein
MTANTALDRDALYYPYIHITDVNWLKATLLCFPNVRRMVPNNYSPDDSEEIREFCEVIGPRDVPLLTSVDMFSQAAARAEDELLRRLQDNDEFIRARYSKEKTVQQYPDPADQFLLHDEKIVLRLYQHLTQGPDKTVLAWRTEAPTNRPTRHSGGQWLALHPDLGNAILATKAMAIADEFGLDIVTDSSAVHHTVVSTKQEDMFEELIGKPASKGAPPMDHTVDELAEIVMTTSFDVRKLSAKQIAILLSDGNDLRRFKDALIPIAAGIPAIKDAKEREKRLRAAAGEITKQWQNYKRSLPGFALEAIADATEIKWPELASSLIAGGTAWHIGGGAGLGILMVSWAGVKTWKKYQRHALGPYAYLSRIRQLVSKTETSLVLPPIS